MIFTKTLCPWNPNNQMYMKYLVPLKLYILILLPHLSQVAGRLVKKKKKETCCIDYWSEQYNGKFLGIIALLTYWFINSLNIYESCEKHYAKGRHWNSSTSTVINKLCDLWEQPLWASVFSLVQRYLLSPYCMPGSVLGIRVHRNE